MAQRSRSERIRGGFKRVVKNIVQRIDHLLPEKTGQDSVSVALQWLSQTLDWVQLWADNEHTHDSGFSPFESPIPPAFHDADNSSMQWHP